LRLGLVLKGVKEQDLEKPRLIITQRNNIIEGASGLTLQFGDQNFLGFQIKRQGKKGEKTEAKITREQTNADRSLGENSVPTLWERDEKVVRNNHKEEGGKRGREGKRKAGRTCNQSTNETRVAKGKNLSLDDLR